VTISPPPHQWLIPSLLRGSIVVSGEANEWTNFKHIPLHCRFNCPFNRSTLILCYLPPSTTNDADMCHEVDLENIPHIAWPLITALSANISATAG